MIEHVITTGDVGRLRIQDNTDDSNLMNAELWVQSLSPVAIPNLPWTYSINNNMSGWRSFNFLNTTMWQRLAIIYVGTAEKLTLHLGATGTSHLGGPTDHTVNLAGYVPSSGAESGLITVRVGDEYKRAVPYVNDEGVWRVAKPYVRGERGWIEL